VSFVKTARVTAHHERLELRGWPPLVLIDTDAPAPSSSDAVSHIDSGAVDAGQSPSWQAWRTDSGGFKQRFVRNRFLFQTAWPLSVDCTHFLFFSLHGTYKLQEKHENLLQSGNNTSCTYLLKINTSGTVIRRPSTLQCMIQYTLFRIIIIHTMILCKSPFLILFRLQRTFLGIRKYFRIVIIYVWLKFSLGYVHYRALCQLPHKMLHFIGVRCIDTCEISDTKYEYHDCMLSWPILKHLSGRSIAMYISVLLL